MGADNTSQPQLVFSKNEFMISQISLVNHIHLYLLS